MTVLLFAFVAAWNNFFLPLLVLQRRRLSTVIVSASPTGTRWRPSPGNAQVLYAIVITGSVVAILPVMLAVPVPPAVLAERPEPRQRQGLTACTAPRRSLGPGVVVGMSKNRVKKFRVSTKTPSSDRLRIGPGLTPPLEYPIGAPAGTGDDAPPQRRRTPSSGEGTSRSWGPAARREVLPPSGGPIDDPEVRCDRRAGGTDRGRLDTPGPGTREVDPPNPGFEADGTAVPRPSGWKTRGDRTASSVEAGGHSGSFHLTHRSSTPFSVENRQELDGLANGRYTLTAWVRRSTGENRAYIALDDCGNDGRTYLPVSTGDWLRIVVNADVRRHSCTIVLHTDGGAGEWSNFDDVSIARGSARLSVLGGDVSSLTKSEDFGGVYRNESGRRGDALAILKDHGLNWIRVRVWVDPADGYHDTRGAARDGQACQGLGLKLLVNLHYSDFWADPGQAVDARRLGRARRSTS